MHAPRRVQRDGWAVEMRHLPWIELAIEVIGFPLNFLPVSHAESVFWMFCLQFCEPRFERGASINVCVIGSFTGEGFHKRPNPRALAFEEPEHILVETGERLIIVGFG